MKKVLITGGTKGLGLATARLFARQGSELYLSYRSDEESAKRALESIQAIGKGSCTLIRSDLSMEDGSQQIFDQLSQHTQTLDVYIHNAAATAFKTLNQLESHHIDKTLNITIKSFILGMKRVEGLMKERGGAVVTVSGMDTLRAVPRHGLLGAAKSALQTLTSYYAHEFASKDIRVNGINPGFFATESTRKMYGPMFDLVYSEWCKATPVKPKLDPIEEIANIILFLSSEQSRWLAGQTLFADGGWNFAMPASSPQPQPTTLNKRRCRKLNLKNDCMWWRL